MRNLTNRLNALERANDPARPERYEWATALAGETNEQTRARYEGEHGELPPRVGLLIWQEVQPGEVRPCA